MPSQDSYLCLAQPTQGLYKEKGSKFIAYAYPIGNEDDVRALIAALRKEHHGARHVCWAYVLGAQGQIQKSADDGEPSGTAGRPILMQIVQKGLSHVLVAVVRYFGGILLGTGGLIQAYRGAAADALEDAPTETKIVEAEYQLVFPYSAMNDVMKTIKDMGIGSSSLECNEQCSICLSVRNSLADMLIARLGNIEGVKCDARL